MHWRVGQNLQNRFLLTFERITIYEYIAFQLFAPDRAEGQIDRIEGRILGLEDMPERFRAYEKEPWFSRDFRVTAVDRYRIFYIPDKEQRIVSIVRVLYEGMDIDKQLRES